MPYQQNAVSKIVWAWTETEGTDGVDVPSKKSAFVGFLVGGTVAAILYTLKPDHRVFSYVVFGIATFFLLSALFLPALYAGIQRILGIFARGVGVVMSYLLLVPFFYLVFPIIRLIQLLTNKDPLQRKFPAENITCWEDRPPITDKAFYTRQG